MVSPRFEKLEPLLIVGLREPMTEQSAQTIPELWRQFAPYIDRIPCQIMGVSYGLCVHTSDSRNGLFYYMAGCAVSEFAELPPSLSPLIVPAHYYAVFSHDTGVVRIRETIDFIFDKWLPNSNYLHDNQSLHFFERYGKGYNPQTGFGDIEIWLPVTTKK